MKITAKKAFHFVHSKHEEFYLDPKKAVEVSKQAYEHLVYVFGEGFFTVVSGDVPKDLEKNPVDQAVGEKGAGKTGEDLLKEDEDKDDEEEDEDEKDKTGKEK